jgi:hypothetical protein
VGALAIPTAHNRNEKGGTQCRKKSSAEMRRRKFKGQPDFFLDAKTSTNDGKHHRITKTKINPKNP